MQVGERETVEVFEAVTGQFCFLFSETHGEVLRDYFLGYGEVLAVALRRRVPCRIVSPCYDSPGCSGLESPALTSPILCVRTAAVVLRNSPRNGCRELARKSRTTVVS